jgi:hypothetical protein
MTTVAVKGETRVARPLPVLVPLIQKELAAADAAGIEHYRRAGEMLIEAKGQLERGEWQPWLKRHFELTQRTATNYMRLARDVRAAENGSGTSEYRPRTLKEAIGDFRSDTRPAWHRPVQQVIAQRLDVERLAAERKSREHEAKLTRELAHQLIDIGYRVLAAKLHPDKGGSHQAMKRLNHVRQVLRRAV